MFIWWLFFLLLSFDDDVLVFAVVLVVLFLFSLFKVDFFSPFSCLCSCFISFPVCRSLSTDVSHANCSPTFLSGFPLLFCSLSLIIVLFISMSRLILILYYHLVTLLTIVLVSRLRPLVREEERERNIYVYMCMKKKLKINLNWFFDIQNWRETTNGCRSHAVHLLIHRARGVDRGTRWSDSVQHARRTTFFIQK